MINEYLDDNEVKQIQMAYLHEKENSLIYDSLSIWLDSKGLTRLADYYRDWSHEENTHSKWVRNFMMNLGIPVLPGSIEIEHYSLDRSLLEFINVTKQREDSTTKIYRDLTIAALDMNNIGDDLLLNLTRKMSKEQIEETGKVTSLLSKIGNIKDFSELQLFDNGFKG